MIARCAAAAAAVVLLAAGCTSGGSPAPTGGTTTAGSSPASRSATTSASSPAPSSTSPSTAGPGTASAAPSTWSVAVAQQKYLAYVAPRNRDSNTLGILLQQQSTSLQLFRSTCTALARDEDTLAGDLEAGSWPTSARTAVDAFVPTLRRLAEVHRRCAAASSAPGAIAAIATAPRSQTQADAVRVALGLPKAA